MNFKLYTADCIGNEKNCLYRNERSIDSPGDLAAALAFDHTCGHFKNNYRSKANFISSDCIVMDFDNDKTEDPSEWMTPDKIASLLPDVNLAIAPSRHNMLPKGTISARPRGHVYFPIENTTDPEKYASIKASIRSHFPFFDDNAVDAARFIFGTGMDADDILWQDGWLNIDEELAPALQSEEREESTHDTIPSGQRNKTMSRFAARLLKKLGDTEGVHNAFLLRATKCDPPLPEEELRTIWSSALRFYKKTVSQQKDYVDPKDYNDDFAGGEESGSLKPEDYSDIGEAKALVAEYGSELRYTDATDYLVYDGDYWNEDKQMAVGVAEEFLDMQLADAQQEVTATREALIRAGIDEKDISAGGRQLEKAVPNTALGAYFSYIGAVSYLGFVKKRRDYKYIVSALNTAKPMILLNINDLDQDPYLLNTPSATYDLRTGLSHPHDPADLITKMTECDPSSDGAGLWNDAVSLFFDYNDELVRYVQEVVGLAAIGRVYLEHMIIAYGDGANGKSTFWNAIFRVLGNYAGKLSADALTMSCKRNVKPEMAEMKGKRLIIASEMSEGVRLNTAMVKQLCATDEIYAEKKYKAPFSFDPSHTLVLYTNHLPKIGASDDGIWRRLIVIPFNAKITGSSDIKNYADYLVKKAGGAILSWIMDGAKRIIEKDFKTALPGPVNDAILKYREENDWMGHFLEECCEVGNGLFEKSGELYQAYRAYALRNGEYTRSTTDFYTELVNRGFVRQKSRTGNKILGVKLKEEDDF